MILCPNCLHQEMVGALFCSECGAQLIFPTGMPTTVIEPTTGNLTFQDLQPAQSAPPPSPPGTDTLISLNIISTGDALPIRLIGDITLGRVSEGQPVIPDIDLTPYKAYEAGVSRMHATITIDSACKVTITDLASANGTRVNGQQISPNLPVPIKHGDILTLGKFKIQIFLRDR